MSEQNQGLIYVTARASFPWIVQPQVSKNDKGEEVQSYNVDLIFPSNDEGFQKFMVAYATLAADKWKTNAQAAMQMIQSDRKTRCYGAGDEKTSKKTFQVHPGYAGNVFITTRSPRQPQIIRPEDGMPVDPSNTLELRAVASKIYGGCYVNAVIKPWLQENKSGIGIRCDLIAIQFKADGEAFGAGAADVTGMFGATAAPTAPVFAQQPVGAAAPFPNVAAAPSFMQPVAPAAAPAMAPAPAAMPFPPFMGMPQ